MTTVRFKYISGTFLDGVAADIPSNNWDAENWKQEFDIFKKLGMDTGIVIRVGWKNSSMYDSAVMKTTLFEEDDLVEIMLREADRVGMKMFLGLFDSHNYWLKNDWDAEVAINFRLIEELWNRYEHHPSFYGWYLSHEGDIKFHQENIWKPLALKAKSYSGNKKILISPRYAGIKYEPNFAVTPEQHYKHFDYIFDKMEGLIDYAAFMDGHVHFEQLENYVKVTRDVCDKYNIGFWSNLETFDRDMPWKFPPIEWNKMRFKLETVQPYVDKIVTFEAPHFLSPNSLYHSAHNLYKRYWKYMERQKRNSYLKKCMYTVAEPV